MNRRMKTIILMALVIAVAAQADRNPSARRITGYSSTRHTMSVRVDTSAVRFVFYAPGICRTEYLPSARYTGIDSSIVVVRDTTAELRLSITDSDSVLEAATEALRIRCRKDPFTITYLDGEGRVLLQEAEEGGFRADESRRTVSYALPPSLHFYGTGERGTALDKRGQAFDSYNTQVGGYAEPLATMNVNVPFLATSGGFALYFENTFKARFDLGKTDQRRFSYAAAGGELSVYLIAAGSIAGQIERYTWLTGRQPLPPRWALGFIQSKNRYEHENEARAIVDTLRMKQIPCDAIVLDLKWFRNMGDISWDTRAWKNHDAMVRDFLSLGIKTILISEPYIVEPSVNFKEAASRGYLGKDAKGRPYMLDSWWSCGGCNAALLDMTNPDARAWWWKKHPAFLGGHVAGFWTDLGEPERHPLDMHHYLGSTEKIHNIYNLLWAQTIADGFATLRPDERIFNLTRSGYAGIQRYGVFTWSGDVSRSFGGLAVQVPMMLSMGMSGLAWHHSDMGGYARVPTTPELYIRWTEFAAFTPIMRAHGAGEVVKGSPTEPWRFGAQAERIAREYIGLRYRLLPYLYTMAAENSSSGMPLARPLMMAFPDDPAFANEGASYMWGDAFLVAPVVQAGQRTKEVRLPEGAWINFWTDERYEGGRTVTVDAPLERLPLFVKQGSIIPMAPLLQYSDERSLDTLYLHYYPSPSSQGRYRLFEDDGRSRDARSATTSFTQTLMQREGRNRLECTIGCAEGEYNGMPAKRMYVAVVHGLVRAPSEVTSEGGVLAARPSYSALRRSGSGWFFDPETSLLHIQIPCGAGSFRAEGVSLK